MVWGTNSQLALKGDGHNTSRYRVYDIMKFNDLVINSTARSKKRK